MKAEKIRIESNYNYLTAKQFESLTAFELEASRCGGNRCGNIWYPPENTVIHGVKPRGGWGRKGLSAWRCDGAPDYGRTMLVREGTSMTPAIWEWVAE